MNQGQITQTAEHWFCLQGALDMKNKTVKDAMLPLSDVFMIDIDSVMDKSTMIKVSCQKMVVKMFIKSDLR